MSHIATNCRGSAQGRPRLSRPISLFSVFFSFLFFLFFLKFFIFYFSRLTFFSNLFENSNIVQNSKKGSNFEICVCSDIKKIQEFQNIVHNFKKYFHFQILFINSKIVCDFKKVRGISKNVHVFEIVQNFEKLSIFEIYSQIQK